MRWAVTPIRPHRDWHFAQARAGFGRLDQRLGRKLHPRCAEIEAPGDISSHPAHATVDVAHSRSKKQPKQPRKDRGADILMVPRHGAIFDFAVETVANNKFVTFTPLGHKPGYLGEVMAAIGVTQDDECAARFFDS